MNVWMNEWMNEWMEVAGWIQERKEERVDDRKNGSVDVQIEETFQEHYLWWLINESNLS